MVGIHGKQILFSARCWVLGCSGSSFQLKALFRDFEPLMIPGNVQDTVRQVTFSLGIPACGLRLLLKKKIFTYF